MRYLFVLLLLFGCATAPDMSDVEASGIAEAKAYSAMLQEKLDRGEMTDAEARYLYQRKVNELSAIFEATARARAQQGRAVRCRPDGLGGIVCR
jgi:hypothetical protein